MKRNTYAIVAALWLATGSGASGQSAVESQCIVCHREIESEDGPAHNFAEDVHSQNGLGCHDCHGGNPTLDDMDAVRASEGFRGAPNRPDIPAFCARCHADAAYMREHNPALPIDQLDKYRTSIHGIKLLQNKDGKVATCVSCHTAHRIGNARMPFSSTYPANLPTTCGTCHSDQAYMAEYGIPVNQVEHYLNSVHGRALVVKKDMNAPVCNDCHSNHGAAPPGASSVSAVCGTCHAIEEQLYQVSPHKAAFEASDFPMCETCHGNHDIPHPSDALIGFGDDQLCGTCHDANEEGLATLTIDSMRIGLAGVQKAVDSARYLVGEASTRGMMVSDEEFALKELDQMAIQLRSTVHAFSIDSLAPRFTEGSTKARSVQVSAAALIEEYYFRRWGLGISSGIITLLALALYFKIRSIEKTQR